MVDNMCVLCFQTHIDKTFEKYAAVQNLFQTRQTCLKKLADKHVRPVQLVVPRAENPPRSKSPVFSPKHGTLTIYLFTCIYSEELKDSTLKK